MRSSSAVAAAVAIVVCACAGGAARAGTVLRSDVGPNGHFYQLVSDTVSWTEASAAAQAAGGFLATPGNADEQDLVEQMLASSSAPTGSYWIGVREVSGAFQYVSGLSTAGQNNFLPGQPDDFAGNENSGSILWSTAGAPTFDRRGFWNDLPDNSVGYPGVASVLPDLTVKGYVVEFLSMGAGGVGSNVGTGDADDPTGGVGGSPGGGGGNGGNGGGNPIPLPAAAWLFAPGAAMALMAAKRLRRTA